MTTRRFGWTSVQVPVIGQGTWMIEGNLEAERSSIEALQAGIEVGMAHIDTAEMYGSGRAEELVGDAIRGRREQVFLVSKVLPSNASYRGTLNACEQSLRRLDTDYLDLYLLHWRSHHPLRETMRALEELVDSGTVRFIGVSNFDTPELQERCVREAYERAGMGPHDIDVWEINEAFSVVTLYAIKELKIDPEKVNIHGGAVAIGHPLGSSGIRLVGTAARILKETKGKYGLATMCVGGGQGTACIIKSES